MQHGYFGREPICVGIPLALFAVNLENIDDVQILVAEQSHAIQQSVELPFGVYSWRRRLLGPSPTPFF